MTSRRPSPQARRAFLLASLSALALAGCAGGRGSRTVPTQPARYDVAMLAPLTGPDAAVGQALANAARLALADTNNQSVELTVFNTAEGGGAGAAASRALAGGARLILGPLRAEEVRAVAPIARQARVPVIAYSNDEGAAGGGVFILGVVPGQSVERVVAYARTRGAVSFGGLAPASLYGQRSAQALVGAVQRSGGQLVAVERYDSPGEARAAARRLNSRGASDAVLIADTGRVAASIAPQFRSGIRLLGTDLWSGERLGATARLRGAWYATVSDERFGQFTTRYRARYGTAPPRLASLGYDSMLLTISATRNWDPRRRFPVPVLTNPEGFVGVDGVFRFGPDGVAQRGLEVRQVTATGHTVVSPAPASFTR